MKRLQRSSRHRVIFGVCGGIAEYLDVSVALVRLVVLVLAFVGSGIVLYIAGMIIMPQESTDSADGLTTGGAKQGPTNNASIVVVVGLLLVLVGVVLLLDRLDVFNARVLWHTMRNVIVPLAIILFGIAVLARRGKKSEAPPPSGHLEQVPLRDGHWHRARYDRKLFGVCAGIAHAMNVDPTVVRLAWVLLSLHSLGVGFVVYLILGLVLPEEPATA